MGVERTGGFFILSRPSPFPYLVNTCSPPSEKKKKNKNLWPYISIFYCPTFISGQILPGIFGHLMFMLLLIFSTARALAMQDLRLKAVYIFWTSFALAFAGLKNAKKNTPCSADYQGWRKLEVHLWGTYQTTSYVLKRSSKNAHQLFSLSDHQEQRLMVLGIVYKSAGERGRNCSLWESKMNIL